MSLTLVFKTYDQYVTYPTTQGQTTLDLFYGTVSRAYRSLHLPNLVRHTITMYVLYPFINLSSDRCPKQYIPPNAELWRDYKAEIGLRAQKPKSPSQPLTGH